LNYKGKIKPVNRVFLTQKELQALADKQFKIDRLSQVRDIFLFCCFTALAYVDIKKLKTSEIAKGVDGELWIVTNSQKTNTRSAIPLLPSAARLIQKYAQHPLCVTKNVPLPVPGNQKMNGYLKEIAVHA
jgi:integrase